MVTIASPLPATEKAEDDVDDKINTLLHAIDSLGIAWTSAEKVLSDQSLAYDITLSLTSTKRTDSNHGISTGRTRNVQKLLNQD